MIRHLIDFFKIIRWKNVLIYWFIQSLFFIKFYEQINQKDLFFLLVVFFSFIGIAGNIHNNVTDYELDKLKDKSVSFDKKNYSFLYISLYISSLLIIVDFFKNIQTNYLILLFIALMLIISYNIFLKKIALLGNIAVSVASVIAILLPLKMSIFQNNFPFHFTAIMIILVSMMRELAKDMEDKNIDKQFSYKTLPILNLKISKIVFYILSILFFVIILFYYNIFKSLFLLFFIIISAILIIWSINNIVKNKFEQATRLLKLLMLAGIILVVFGID